MAAVSTVLAWALRVAASPLDVPDDLGVTAAPIWSSDPSAFVMVRSPRVIVPDLPHISSAVVFVTAQQSPFCTPDPRLAGNDYAACLPHGGTSQPKLLGAFKLFVNGILVGVGPGRRVNQTQGVDAIDITTVVRSGPNVLALEGYYHLETPQKPSYQGTYGPRLLAQLRVTYVNGTVAVLLSTSKNWMGLAADRVFNPTGSTGAWAQKSGMPHEAIDMREYPQGWTLPNFLPDNRWQMVAQAPPFAMSLGPKSALSARPITVFSRHAASMRILSPNPLPPAPPPQSIPKMCGIGEEASTVVIGCNGTGDIAEIIYASFGTPTGTCTANNSDTFHDGACHLNSTAEILSKLCLGKPWCTIKVALTTNGGFFDDPCHRQHKWLAWHVQCKPSLNVTTPCSHAVHTADATTTYIVDFGRELQGGVNITFSSAVAGDKVQIKLSEELQPDGLPMVPMRTSNNFSDTWTLRDGAQTVSQHEYMEFRWASITVPTNIVLRIDDVSAWVIRYPLSDDPTDTYGDVPTLPSSRFRSRAALATFESSNTSLNAVWDLVRYTLVAVSLDVNTDSNTRQRDLCHTDAFITGIGQLALSNEHGVVQMTAEDGFQLDSNIWQGTTDFRAALILLSYEHSLYTGNLALVRQRFADIKLHSLVHFFDPSSGLISKPSGEMGHGSKCPASWSPAGMPPGIYEALDCKIADLVDWPSNTRDGYVFTNNDKSTVANAYVALAAQRVAKIAEWIGEVAEAELYANVSKEIVTNLRTKLYDAKTGTFADGVGISHSALHSTMFASVAGAVDEAAVPGMGKAVVAALRTKGMVCSCMGGFWLLEALFTIGWDTPEAADYAFELLTANTTRSWQGMIRQGATATMEAWTPDEKPNLSWSHPWCAGPNSIMIRRLLGVRPIDLAWKRWLFAPQPSQLRRVNATVQSALGPISVSLVNGDDFVATFTVPAGSFARVCLPGPGKIVRMDGSSANFVRSGRMLCLATDVAPGIHTVVLVH